MTWLARASKAKGSTGKLVGVLERLYSLSRKRFAGGKPFVALGAVLLLSCRGSAETQRGVHGAQTRAAVAPASSEQEMPSAPPEAPPPEPELPALTAESEFVALDVPGFRPAVVSVPLGAREPRPVVVALHGNFDRPEWQCEVWRAATNAYPFIVCPRGVPRSDVPKSADRWEFGSAKQTERELDAALLALSERFVRHSVHGPVVYVGFSLGAILGTTIVKNAPARYSRVVLIEGGLGSLSASFAKHYKEGGGERMLLACGQASCTQKSRALVRVLEKQGVPARVVDGGSIGHTYDGAIAEGIARDWAWLVEGLPNWSSAQVKAQ